MKRWSSLRPADNPCPSWFDRDHQQQNQSGQKKKKEPGNVHKVQKVEMNPGKKS